MAGSSPALSKAVCNPADKIVANCSAIWKAIGLPDLPQRHPTRPPSVIPLRAVDDNASKTPDWVVEVLNKAKLTNKFPRPKIKFSGDLCIRPKLNPTPATTPRPPTSSRSATRHRRKTSTIATSICATLLCFRMRCRRAATPSMPESGKHWKPKCARRPSRVKRCMSSPGRSRQRRKTQHQYRQGRQCVRRRARTRGLQDRDGLQRRQPEKGDQLQQRRCGPGGALQDRLRPAKERGLCFPDGEPQLQDGTRPPVSRGIRAVNVGVIEKLTGLKFFQRLAGRQARQPDRQMRTDPIAAPAAPAKKKKKPR